VILKNENVHDEMVEIMSQLYQYVPSIEYTTEVHTAGIDDVKREALIHPLLLGGDQLTAARARGVIKSRINSKSPAACFKGLTPCIEDWHVQMLLLEVYKLKCDVAIATCVFSIIDHMEALLFQRFKQRIRNNVSTAESDRSL